MRIDENKVFVFTFDTGEMGNLAIPIRGESREQAANSLQNMFSRMQVELATEFPKVSPVATQAPISDVLPTMPAAEGLAEILSERIDVLLDTLGGGKLNGPAKAETIKNWTEIEYIPANYAKIVTELELIVSGQKIVPVKGKKK